MFGGLGSKKSILSKKGSAIDVIPNSLNWNDVSGSTSPVTTNSQTITGITSSINLNVKEDYADWDYGPEYKINSGSWIPINVQGGNTVTFSVNNGDSVTFRFVFSSGFVGSQQSLEIRNQSNGNAVLDYITFTYG
jgi:hypothetical protein